MALGVCLVMLPAHAADEGRAVTYGRHLAQQCTACHRIDGVSQGGIPAIVGWPVEQFTAVLESFKRGERTNAAMVSIAQSLSDDEIAALAAYFGALKPATRKK